MHIRQLCRPIRMHRDPRKFAATQEKFRRSGAAGTPGRLVRDDQRSNRYERACSISIAPDRPGASGPSPLAKGPRSRAGQGATVSGHGDGTAR